MSCEYKLTCLRPENIKLQMEMLTQKDSILINRQMK